MNDLQIFQLMMKTPDIRAVQISDALDVELADVSRALRDLVECGTVTTKKGFAPNGVQAQQYNLSEDFKASAEYAKLNANMAKAAVVHINRLEVPAPKFADVQPPAPHKSRVERGLEYVTEHGPATNDQMRKAMGLTAKDYPAAYLVSATNSGKLHYTAQCWHAGPAPAQLVTTTRGEQLRKHGPVVSLKPDEVAPAVTADELKDLPAALVQELSKPAQAQAAKPPMQDPDVFVEVPEPPLHVPAGPVFRCGLWSDGVIELQRNGVQVARLTQGEGEHLADFMRRMLGQVERVAA